MTQVSVRYIVDDVDAAVVFYSERLGFEVEAHPAPAFAVLSRGDLRLLLNSPGGPGGAAQPARDGRIPEPGGWNRIQLEVADLDAEVERLRGAGGVGFRTRDRRRARGDRRPRGARGGEARVVLGGAGAGRDRRRLLPPVALLRRDHDRAHDQDRPWMNVGVDVVEDALPGAASRCSAGRVEPLGQRQLGAAGGERCG